MESQSEDGVYEITDKKMVRIIKLLVGPISDNQVVVLNLGVYVFAYIIANSSSALIPKGVEGIVWKVVTQVGSIFAETFSPNIIHGSRPTPLTRNFNKAPSGRHPAKLNPDQFHSNQDDRFEKLSKNLKTNQLNQK